MILQAISFFQVFKKKQVMDFFNDSQQLGFGFCTSSELGDERRINFFDQHSEAWEINAVPYSSEFYQDLAAILEKKRNLLQSVPRLKQNGSSSTSKRNQLCINTSIVYMHRFYMFHSFKDFHRNVMAPCFLFLGAKVEEQPRKLEHVLKVAYRCLHKDSDSQLDNKSDEYMQMAQDLIDNESILLQTLGFELSVEHPHTFVVNCIQMVKAAKDLAQTSYFLATNSLHLTTFCIEQKPTVVACVCIYVACKWTSYEIPESHDKKHWWEYIDNEVTLASIEEMTSHFIKILDSCPTRLKKKISTGPAIYKGGTLQPKREHEEDPGAVDKHNGASSSKTASKDEKGSSHPEKHRVKNDPSSDPSKLKERKEHAAYSHGTHSKHQSHPESHKNLELDRKHAEHHKHRSEHKHRHSEHNKHKSELSKHDEGNFNKQIAKKRPDSKDNTMKIPEIKSSSSMSKPTEKASVKDSGSAEKAKIAEEPSAAAKMILSLPPLQHKHSLPDAEKSSSESPAKKKKLDSDSAPAKKPKLDLDSNTVAGHPKAHTLPSGKTSDDKAQAIPGGPIGSSSISGSHHKRHKSSHSKHSSSKDKHKEKVPGDKHSSHHHKQQSSHKSSHGQKHHTKTSSQDSSGGSKYSESDRGSASDISINESPRKHVSEYGSQKDGHNPGVTASRHHKPVKTPQKSSSDPSGTFMKSTKTPQKSQPHPKLTPKTPLPKSEDSLPPPPPPPCVDMSVLSPPPSVPTEMYPNANKETPSKPPASAAPSPYGMPAMQMRQPGNQAADQLQQGNVSDNSALLNSGHMHHNMLPMQPTGMNPPHVQASPSFPRQSQYLNTSQASSAAGSYGISPMYFQGKDGQSTATNLPLLHPQFVSPQKGNLHPPPLPPPGFVLTQISGLPPPPPPLNLPFPPPP